MITVASRELRNQTRRVLERVESGEEVVITVDGRPVARLSRASSKPRWVAREALFSRLPAIQADAGLTAELEALAPETTDDLGEP